MSESKVFQTFFFLLFFLIVVPHPVCAAEWISYSSNNLAKLYYDKSNIKVEGTLARVWEKEIYNLEGKIDTYQFLKSAGKVPKSLDTVSYSLLLTEFDCIKNKARTASYSTFDQNDKIIYSASGLPSEWDEIIPESVADNLKKLICSGSSQ
jgi:hypothetical protein